MSNLNKKYYPEPLLPFYTEAEVIYIDRYNQNVTVSYKDKDGKEQSLELKSKKPNFVIIDFFKLGDKMSAEIVGYDVFLHYKDLLHNTEYRLNARI